MDRRAFVFAVAALAPGIASAQTPGADPRALVEEIYRLSAGADGKYGHETIFRDAATQRRWMSKSLAAAYAAMERKSKRLNEPILDFDPVTNSQDPDVQKLTIVSESTTDTRAVVLVRFFYGDSKSPNNVRYIFVREGGAWKVDEMTGDTGGKDKWSLRKIIK